jgi:hypothetical protein
MTREIWTNQDELEFQIGDMNGIAFDRPTQVPENKGKSVPIVRPPKQEKEKHHIKNSGKK